MVFSGAFAVAVWHAGVVWTGERRWPAKSWSVVLALACTTLLYAALAFTLIAFDINY